MKKVRWKEMVTGVVLGTVFMSPWSSLFEVRPYTDVQLVSVAKADTAVTITANFRKTDCSFQRLEVFGYDLGKTIPELHLFTVLAEVVKRICIRAPLRLNYIYKEIT